MIRKDIRNIAIIAHVDHGKTSLVDCMLRQSGEFRESQLSNDLILDSNDLERERGITILAKNIALPYKDTKINIIDTPGHADFGGEVERVLQMADGAIVMVDAAEGPMPQTRFVLSKAFEVGLKPIVVINKIDRPDGRPMEALNEVFELFLELGADDDLADFPYIFASARDGYASHNQDDREGDITPLMDMILEHIPGPDVEPDEPLKLLVTTLDWSEYVGRIAIGRIQSGTISKNENVAIIKEDGNPVNVKISTTHVFDKLGRVEVETATAGDIVAIVGLEGIEIGDTITDREKPVALPRLKIDEPTLQLIFGPNTSPFAGKDGKYVTTRHIRDRLYKELERNVAMRVEPVENTEKYRVSGRGLLHISVLIETMRREGFELAIGKPIVITRKVDGVLEEPYEQLVVEVPPETLGPVMELVGERRGELIEMSSRGEYNQVSFSIPARGLIGLRTKVLNATAGTAMMHHRFTGYRKTEGEVPGRQNGVLVSNVAGKAVAFGLDGLQERAEMFVAPGDPVYEGMIVGENSRSTDMTVNPTKEKKLTNMRASGSDKNIVLKPPRVMTLEMALEYIEDDELVEITPSSLRIRKMLLTENERKRANRSKSTA